MRASIRVVLFIALFSASQAGAQTFDELFAAGEGQLKAGQYDQAIETFTRAESLAATRSDPVAEAKSFFYLGFAHQQQARTASPPDAAALRSKAAGFYQRSIWVRPLGAALNNLAALWREGENSDSAAKLYDQAISLHDGRQAFYASNYADFLYGRNELGPALKYYRIANAQSPGDARIERRIVEILARTAPSEHDTLTFVWDLACRGETERAVGEMLALSNNRKFSPLSESLALLAFALSQDRSGTTIRDPKVRATLEQWATTNRGADELLRLIRGGELDPAAFSWWSEQGGPGEASTCHRAPLDAFRLLARNLAFLAEAQGDARRAEKYYLLAVELGPFEADPNAFVDLASFYGKRNEPGKIVDAATVFEPRLFQGKGMAYQHNALKSVYDYHRALGVMYSQLGIWENPSRPAASAIFQLEHAEDVARQINEGGRWKEYGLDKPLEPAPAMKVLLSEAYERTNQHEKAIATRLDAVSGYLRMNDVKTAQEEVRPLDKSVAVSGSAADRERYGILQMQIETMQHRERRPGSESPGTTWPDPDASLPEVSTAVTETRINTLPPGTESATESRYPAGTKKRQPAAQPAPAANQPPSGKTGDAAQQPSHPVVAGKVQPGVVAAQVSKSRDRVVRPAGSSQPGGVPRVTIDFAAAAGLQLDARQRQKLQSTIETYVASNGDEQVRLREGDLKALHIVEIVVSTGSGRLLVEQNGRRFAVPFTIAR